MLRLPTNVGAWQKHTLTLVVTFCEDVTILIMENGDAIDDSLRNIATLWTDYFEKQYNLKYYKVINQLTKKAGLKNLSDESKYTAGLLYVELYDLFGALSTKSIKNLKIAEGLVELLADGYDVDAEDIWRILNSMSGVILPWGVFSEVYKLFEPSANFNITNSEARKGFVIFSNSIWQNSNIGYLFDHGMI